MMIYDYFDINGEGRHLRSAAALLRLDLTTFEVPSMASSLRLLMSLMVEASFSPPNDSLDFLMLLRLQNVTAGNGKVSNTT